MITPERLRPGDKVSLLAPSGHQPDEDVHLVGEAVSFLESWGLEVCLQSGIHDRHALPAAARCALALVATLPAPQPLLCHSACSTAKRGQPLRQRCGFVHTENVI